MSQTGLREFVRHVVSMLIKAAFNFTLFDVVPITGPGAILDLLTSFVYLERFPINFISRVFTPHFLVKVKGKIYTDYSFYIIVVSKLEAGNRYLEVLSVFADLFYNCIN